MTYTRANPSPRYRDLLACYRQMHEQGDTGNGLDAATTFDGHAILPHITTIRDLVAHFGARTLLDYGSGKAAMYQRRFDLPDGTSVTGLQAAWNVDSIRHYDPGHAPYATLPEGTFDAVICTDVLEHITEEDLDWVIDELFGYARKVVYAAVATYPARKTLPNGMNAHVTVQPAAWWREKFRARRAATNSPAEYALIIQDAGPVQPQVELSFRAG